MSATAATLSDRRSVLYAPILMTLSAVLFGLMAVTLRLATAEVSSFEAAFFRSFLGLIFSLPLLIKPGFALLRTRRASLYLLRGLSGTISMLASFWALAHLPLAQAISISYSTPLFVTIGAVVLLGEIVRARRWSAVLIGFVGVLIIMRPWSMTMTDSHATFDLSIALLGAAVAASSYISIKFLSRTEPADAVVIYMTVIMTPLSLIPALFFWTWPDASGWLWLVLTALIATIAQVCMTRAYKAGDVSALVPINFIQLPVVVICGYFLFGQQLDAATAIGATIIIGANIYIARREALLARRAVIDPQLAACESGQPGDENAGLEHPLPTSTRPGIYRER